MGKQSSMTKSDSSRIQSSQVMKAGPLQHFHPSQLTDSQARGGGNMSSTGFAARAQSAGDRWAASQSTPPSAFTTSSFGFGKGSAGSGASSGAQGKK